MRFSTLPDAETCSGGCLKHPWGAKKNPGRYLKHPRGTKRIYGRCEKYTRALETNPQRFLYNIMLTIPSKTLFFKNTIIIFPFLGGCQDSEKSCLYGSYFLLRCEDNRKTQPKRAKQLRGVRRSCVLNSLRTFRTTAVFSNDGDFFGRRRFFRTTAVFPDGGIYIPGRS